MPTPSLLQQIDLILSKSGTALKDFISSLVQGLQFNSNKLDTTYSALLAQAYYNGQKMVLQNALNTYFSLSANTIIVATVQNPVVNQYFYEQSENIPKYFYEQAEAVPVFMYESSEAPTGYSFTISIPVGIATAAFQAQVAAVASQWALAGKIFTIVTY